MQSTENEARDFEDAVNGAFAHRIMQVALHHHVDRGLDAVVANQFQQLGLFKDVNPPPLPSSTAAILTSDDPNKRGPIPDGPNVFVREEKSIAVIEVASLLVRPEREIRCAALLHLTKGAGGANPWITTNTAQLLQNEALNIQDETSDRWRPAGIKAATAIRSDLISCLAGLRQSLSARFEEGVEQFSAQLMRPRLKELAPVRPPLWNPAEQKDELRTSLQELAKMETLEAALTGYANRWGYVPLGGEFAASEVVRLWRVHHSNCEVRWEDIWVWAMNSPQTVAKYHAIEIAMRTQNLLPRDPGENFWAEVTALLASNDNDDRPTDSDASWRILSDAISHYVRHIEAIYPAQDGDRLACYAAWLAAKFCENFVGTEQAAAALQRIVEPESELSFRRWMIARSPTGASALRYLMLQLRNIWTFSFLATLRRAVDSVSFKSCPELTRLKISAYLRGCLISTPIADPMGSAEPFLAFQDPQTSDYLGRWTEFLSEKECEVFLQIIAYRHLLSNTAELQSRLDHLGDLPEHEQTLTILFLESTVSASRQLDPVLIEWLAQADRLANTLKQVKIDYLDRFLESLGEFHRRQAPDWISRLPHLLAYSLDQLEEQNRAATVVRHIFLMSINTGIASPVRRVAASRWRSELINLVNAWRNTIVTIGKISEPWVSARVRSMESTVSRIVGPRHIEDSDLLLTG